jgi:hypothetical protein
VAFANTRFAVNPGITATFPWGSGIAPNYEEYECKSISFVYEPESSSTATGAVILSFDYDALNAAPSTKQAALEISDSIRSAPWVPSRLTLKTVDLQKRGTLFTRTSAVANSDLKTYDLGNINVSTMGQATTAIVGEFWIEYHFVLRIPQPSSSTSSSGSSGTLYMAAATAVAPFTGAVALGTLTMSGSGTTLSLSGLTIGTELLVVYGANSAGAAYGALSAPVGLTVKTQFPGGGTGYWYTYTVTATSATLTVTLNGSPPYAALCVASVIPTSTL